MPTSKEARGRIDGFWKIIATWWPTRGCSLQPPALIRSARSSRASSSSRSRSEMLRKSRPRRVKTVLLKMEILGLLILSRLSKMRRYELPGDDRPVGEVEGRVEFRQPVAQRALVAQRQDQVAAAGRVEPEVGRPEDQRLGAPQLDGQPVGDPDLGPAARLPVDGGGERSGLDPVPEGVLLGAAGDNDQSIT